MNKEPVSDVFTDKDIIQITRKFSTYKKDVAEKKTQIEWDFKQMVNKITRTRKEMIEDIKRIENATLKALDKEKEAAMKRIADVSKMMEKINKRYTSNKTKTFLTSKQMQIPVSAINIKWVGSSNIRIFIIKRNDLKIKGKKNKLITYMFWSPTLRRVTIHFSSLLWLVYTNFCNLIFF